MATSRDALVVVGPDGPRPFMRGIMVQSLVSRGVPFEVALETATRVRDRVAVRGEVFADELSKLSELREKGVITDAELQAQKAKLLG